MHALWGLCQYMMVSLVLVRCHIWEIGDLEDRNDLYCMCTDAFSNIARVFAGLELRLAAEYFLKALVIIEGANGVHAARSLR